MSYKNFNQALIGEVSEIISTGEPVEVRGNKTLELRHRCIDVENPIERVVCVPGRNNNIFAAIAETLWVLAGKNDIKFLLNYLPRAADFSDDGNVWRAGYGPRIRNFYGVDQVREVINLLRKDQSSRQAVISIWDPQTDFQKSRDIPCNNWLHFMIRNGKLEMSVAIRSNDLIWGASGINWFEWSVLQELIAFNVGAEVGSVHYFADSLHIYDRHFGKARSIVHGSAMFNDMYHYHAKPAKFRVAFEDLDRKLSLIMSTLDDLNAGKWGTTIRVGDEFLDSCVDMLVLYDSIRRKDANSIATNFMSLGRRLSRDTGSLAPIDEPLDFKVAAAEYILRDKSMLDDGNERLVEFSKMQFVGTPEEEFLKQFSSEKHFEMAASI